MTRQTNAVVVLLAIVSSVPAPRRAVADDWATFRHDSARSGVTSETLRAPLHSQWTYVPKHRPQPAWPEPGKEMHRMPFDYAYQVAVAGGTMYFGSSADSKVYALDAATGRERWSFFTDGPIRFAPAVSGQRVLVGSDDGWLYCLSADRGKLLWKFRGGPRDERVLGNGHIISRWPLRTGVVVVDGIAYFAARMWPAEGVYVYAVRVEDGSVVWKNDSCGSMYIRLPHPTAEAFSGVAPQGHIVAHKDWLFVPTGRSIPAAFDRRTGRFLYYYPAVNLRDGGSWACAAADLFFCAGHGGGPDIDVRLGEAPPAGGDGMKAWSCDTGDRRLELRGRHRLAIDGNALYTSGSGYVTAYDLKGLLLAGKPVGKCIRWHTPHGRAYSLIVAGQTVVVGGSDTVTAFSAVDGSVVWKGSVSGQARGLAVADGRLLVSSSTGRIRCFGSQPATNPATVSATLDASPYPDNQHGATCASQADRILKETGITAGFCLDVGAGHGRLACELAKRSNLCVYGVEPDAAKVAAARQLLDAAGLYGVRVTIHQGALSELAYPHYFADLVVLGEGFAGELDDRSARELYRVLRPCGGAAYLALPTDRGDVSVAALRRALQAAGVPDAEIRVSEAAIQIVRGPLPGAGAWTSAHADAGKSGCSSDEIVKWPLKLLWFGGPGPARIISRHYGPSPPVSANGRLFVAGQHTIIAVDAYNGRELWTRDLPAVGRTGASWAGGNLVAENDSAYAATGSVCFRLDAKTGDISQRYRMPTRSARFMLDTPQTFKIAIDENRSGTVTLQATTEALVVRLATVDDRVTNRHRDDPSSQDAEIRSSLQGNRLVWEAQGDSWELYFDFRPVEQRGGLYGMGTFQAFVVPATIEHAKASCKAGAGSAHPKLTVAGKLTETGSETTVKLPWTEIEELVGSRPRDFGFGLTLNASDDGEKLTGRAHKFATPDSHRLTNGWATVVLDPKTLGLLPEHKADLLPAELVESLTWGYLAVTDGLIVGSMGTRTEAEYVFALGKCDGKLHWLYKARDAVPVRAMAVGDGRLNMIDATGRSKLQPMLRRGQGGVTVTTLLALDISTGKVVWQNAEKKTVWKAGDERSAYTSGPAQTNLSFADGVLLASRRDGLTAYSGRDGVVLWTSKVACSRLPVIVRNVVYAEPYALDLKTGRNLSREHPLTGAQVTRRFRRAYGCGSVSASPNLLSFRSGALGFCDLAGDTGTHNFGGVRPGCFINVIAANGLVLAPEGTSSCTCAYNYQTSVALMPAVGRGEDWSVFSVATASGTRIRRLRLNLGATGDRRDREGRMWLGFPRPIYTEAVPVPMLVECEQNLGRYQHNA